MNRHNANAYNAEIVLRRLTLQKWIIRNASDDRLRRILEVVQEELNNRQQEAAA